MSDTLVTDDAHSLLVRLNDALATRRRHDVDDLIGRLIAVDPPLGRQWLALATASRQTGALDHARVAIARYARGGGMAPFERATFLAEIGDSAAAETVLATLPATMIDAAVRAHFSGGLALERGDIEGAAASFRQAIRHRPGAGASWLSLAEASRGTPAADWVTQVIDASPLFETAQPRERAPFLYALGSAFDALEERGRAFAAFAEGGALVRALRPYNRTADATAARAALGYEPPRAPGRAGGPIFVFGPPRSGTTLVEQIFAAHSTLIATGETTTLDIMMRDVGGLDAQAIAEALARSPAQAWGADYRKLLHRRTGTKARTVDKTLNMTRYAGFIATVLPDATLVWVRRDPRDVAWSCFRTFFASGVSWSFDLVDIAHHLRLEDALLGHWRDTLGDRLLVVDYDALTADPAAVIPALLDHAGLAPEPAVFSPELGNRQIRTASVSQVRRPINRTAVGAAEPYRHYLQPFLDAYAT